MSRNNKSQPDRTTRKRSERFGFTLPELLVALAIFLSVMGGVGLLFVNGLRVMRQGFQNQEAFEQSRNLLKVIEQDLSRAFTSRDYGDYYNFYGTPIGFSFVGVVAPRIGSSETNLSRVTYVVWHDPNFDDATDPNLLDPSQVEDILSPTDVDTVGVTRSYRLLRFVEPGVNTLDDYPVDWYAAGSMGFIDGSNTSLGDLIDFALDPFCSGCSGDPTSAGYAQVAARRDLLEIVAAKKKEIWIRLLSGGDTIIPNAWDANYQNAGFIELNDPTTVTPEIPADYVVSENILYTWLDQQPNVLVDEDLTRTPVIRDTENIGVRGTDPSPFITGDGRPAYFFLYADVNVGQVGVDGFGNPIEQVNTIPVRYWNDIRNIEIPNNGLDDDRDGLIDEEFPAYEIPAQNGIDDDGDGLVDEPSFPSDREIVDGFDNDGDGLIDELPNITEPIGSPLEPRLPQQVSTFFTLFFESPYPGAPDFRRRFDQNIDIPTGYRRLKGL